MANVNVQVGSYSLQSSSVITREIQHDSATPLALDTLQISRQDGAKLIASNYLPKQITLTGIIRADTSNGLEDTIDTFKKSVSVAYGNLDIDYAGAKRRYIVGVSGIAIDRSFFHRNFAPFRLSFSVFDPPFALAIESLGGDLAVNETLSADGNTDQVIESTQTFGGSAPPRPILRYVIDNATNLETIKVGNQGKNQQLALATAWDDGDQVVIDTEGLEVLRNGVPLGYSGFFPEFDVGSNTMTTQLQGSGTVTLQRVGTSGFYTLQNPSHYAAVKFTAPTTTTYPYVELLMQRRPELDGNLTLEIRTNNAGVPSSTVVTNGSVTIPATDVPENVSGWVMFRFATPPSLTGSTDYWFLIKGDSINQPSLKLLSLNRFNNPGDTMVFSYNAGAGWITDNDVALNYRLVIASSGWSVDIKSTYTKRFL